MANIGVKRSPGSSIPWKTKCGATVITNNTLLTAAHCFKDRSWNGLMVRIGDNIINDPHDDEYLRELEISEVEFHEGYVEGKAQFDIGIHLKSKLITAAFIYFIFFFSYFLSNHFHEGNNGLQRGSSTNLFTAQTSRLSGQP